MDHDVLSDTWVATDALGRPNGGLITTLRLTWQSRVNAVYSFIGA